MATRQEHINQALFLRLDEIIDTLRFIQGVLEWQKTAMQASQDNEAATYERIMNEMMEKAVKKNLELQRQAYEEHERLFHRGGQLPSA